MKIKNNSLYNTLSISILAIVIFAMGIYFIYNYQYNKSYLTQNLQKRTDISALQLKKVIMPFMSAYAINEYENILLSYMQYQDIYAIVVEDDNMAQILGDNSEFVTGKIRNNLWDIVSLDQNSKTLDQSLYSSSQNIINNSGDKIGRVTVYGTKKFIEEQLNDIVIKSFIMICVIAILLICFLYFILNLYVFTPLRMIIDVINHKNSKGLPLEQLHEEMTSHEFEILRDSMNRMIANIKESRHHLEELNHSFKTAYHNYQNILYHSSDAVFIMQLDGKLIEYSQMVQTLLGYDTQELKTLSVFDWDKELTPELFNEMVKNINDTPLIIERIHTRKDGTTYNAEITAVKVIIDGKEHLHASVRDITQRKADEALIKAQKEEFETIFNYSKDGIAILDLNTNFKKFNDAYVRMTGFTKEELYQKSCKELTIKEDFQKTEEALQEVLQYGYIENFEKTCLLKGNKRIQVNISMSLLPDKQRILMVTRDTSSLKIMQEQAKLASMGEMIGNIAHQWRQPLSVITSSASGLKLQSDFGSVASKDIDECVEHVIYQANYLSNTIDNFRDFIKGNKAYKQISIKECVQNSLSLIGASAKNNYINIKVDLEHDLNINGNQNELSEAFINILNNSIDALKQKVSIEKDRWIFIQSLKKRPNCLQIRILDSAGGIDEEVIDRIFEPYFTTKHQYHGTGLGLSISDKIIRERLHGSITVHNERIVHENKEFKAACFVITFKID